MDGWRMGVREIWQGRTCDVRVTLDHFVKRLFPSNRKMPFPFQSAAVPTTTVVLPRALFPTPLPPPTPPLATAIAVADVTNRGRGGREPMRTSPRRSQGGRRAAAATAAVLAVSGRRG